MTQAPWQQGAPPQQYQGPPNQGWQQPPQGYAGPPQQYQQAPPQAGSPAQGQPWQQTPQAPPASPPQVQSAPEEDGDDEFFTGSAGGKYMSFGDDRCIGAPRGGEIVGVSERQQTDAKTKEPAFWPNSDRPIMIKIVAVQTQERIPDDPDDTGLRSIWLPTSRDITKAVIDAMKAAQLPEMRLRVGGQLWITRTGSRQTTQSNGAKGNPAFTYTAQYIPPPPGARNDAFFAGPPANGQASAQSTPPQQGPPAQGPQSQTPWQQGPPPQQGNPYAANGQAGQGGWQQGQQGLPANNGAPWGQQPPQQGGWQQGPPQNGSYQPSAVDPSNPWGNQQGPPPQGWQGQQYPQQ